MLRFVRSLFRRRPKRRLTGVVQYQSVDRQTAWIAPHDWLPIFTVERVVLKKSGFLRDPLKAGDRVYWFGNDMPPRRLYRYRKAQGQSG
jgi:hypothetical protein